MTRSGHCQVLLVAKSSRCSLAKYPLPSPTGRARIGYQLGCSLSNQNVTSVLVVDDHPIIIQGCRRLLADAGITSVLEASDVAAGYELFCRHRPDVAILDLAMGENGIEGVSLIQRIKSHDPQARILVLSMHRDPIIVARALEAGASGYILKDTATEDLLSAIQIIQEGNPYLSRDLALEVT
jgi:two-component system invasion response regulator UvrY